MRILSNWHEVEDKLEGIWQSWDEGMRLWGDSHQRPGNYCPFILREISSSTEDSVDPSAWNLRWTAKGRKDMARGRDNKWSVGGEKKDDESRGGGVKGVRGCEVTSISPSLSSKNWSGRWIRLHSTQTKSFGYLNPPVFYQLNFPRQMLTGKMDIERSLILLDNHEAFPSLKSEVCTAFIHVAAMW